jgi:hypothetical protein
MTWSWAAAGLRAENLRDEALGESPFLENEAQETIFLRKAGKQEKKFRGACRNSSVRFDLRPFSCIPLFLLSSALLWPVFISSGP